MIDIRLVEHFVLLMTHGSLTRAEAESGVPKATLSRQIARLEAELGMPLFVRTPRRMVPTEAAQTYLLHCRQVLAELGAGLDQARVAVQNLAEGLSGDLRVLTSNYFSTSFVCQVLKAFAERHPQVSCHLDLAGDGLQDLPEGVDCYVCTHLPRHPHLVAKRLGRLAYGLFASPRYLRQHGLPAQPDELKRHRSIWLDSPGATPVWSLMSREGACEVPLTQPTTTNDPWVQKTFALDGFGIALLPDYFCRPELETGALLPVLPDWRPRPMPVYGVYPKQRAVGKKLAALLEVMTDCFARIDTLQVYAGRRR
ncbi:LysR family transcriptional regulator [Ideonella dechloratans]|uniref:LysR family transcriptional regulator n=1 Tax=Ideonella dechloratans TaxID=36863 RepID=UPI0035B39C8B